MAAAVTGARVVLLGATGFVGSAVLRELAGRPIRLRAVARGAAPVPADAVAQVQIVTADLTEPGTMAAVVGDADVVVHCVAHIAGEATWRIEDGDTAAARVNVGTVRELATALAGRRTPARVVFAGATTQVGPVGAAVVDGSEIDCPVGEYDRQKLSAERILLDAAASGALRATSIRLPTVFGYSERSTARDKGVVSTMVRRALAGQPLTMWHDGTVLRDLVYVEDVARALGAAVDHVAELNGRHWVLGSGAGIPLRELFERIARIVAEYTGTEVPVYTVPPPDYAEDGDFRSITVDASGFRAITGWSPAVDLDLALRRTVEFCAGSRV